MRIRKLSFIENPTPVDKFFYRVLGIGFGFIFFALIDLMFAFIWLSLWAAYGMFRLLLWAIHTDRSEKGMDTVEKSLWAEMREVARKIEAEEAAKKTKKHRRPRRRGIDGEVMPCIMCDKAATPRGLYCEDHND